MTDYFISQEVGASDSNSGTSQLLPWLTIAKINSSAFNAGDIRNLKRGYIWRERVLDNDNGTSGNPIILKEYGDTGVARPILDGSDVVSGFTTNATFGSEKITNTGFETNTAGYSLDFGHGSVTRVTTEAYTGSASAHVVRGNSGDTRILRYAVASPATYTAGKKYLVSARVKFDAAWQALMPQVRNHTAATFALETDGTFSATVSCEARPDIRLGDWQGGTGWQRIFLVFTVSVAPTSVFNINFSSIGTGATMNGCGYYLDEVTLKEITAGTLTYTVSPGFTPESSGAVWLNATRGLRGGFEGITTAAQCENLPESWVDVAGTLHVHLLDDESPAGYTVEVARRTQCYYNTYPNGMYQTIQGIEVRHCGKGITPDRCHGLTISDVVFRNIGIIGAGNYIDNSGDPSLGSMLITNCQFYGIDSPTLDNYNRASIKPDGPTSLTVTRNYVVGNNGQGMRVRAVGNGTAWSDGTVNSYNEFVDCYQLHFGGDGDNFLHVGNYAHGGRSAGIQPGSRGASPGNGDSFVRNVVDDIHVSSSGYNGFDSNGHTNGFLYHCTISRVSARSATFEENGGRANDGWTVKNNIFDAYNNNSNTIATTGWGGAIYIEASVTGCTFDYNLYREVNTGGADRIVDYQSNGLKSWAQWQGLGHEAHGLNVDPLFVNAAAGDFRLQATSPCRDAGVVIAGINDGTGGSQRFAFAAPDMGAHEYPESAPTGGGVIGAGFTGGFALRDPAASWGSPQVQTPSTKKWTDIGTKKLDGP
jgi:hypothetical protein